MKRVHYTENQEVEHPTDPNAPTSRVAWSVEKESPSAAPFVLVSESRENATRETIHAGTVHKAASIEQIAAKVVKQVVDIENRSNPQQSQQRQRDGNSTAAAPITADQVVCITHVGRGIRGQGQPEQFHLQRFTHDKNGQVIPDGRPEPLDSRVVQALAPQSVWDMRQRLEAKLIISDPKDVIPGTSGTPVRGGLHLFETSQGERVLVLSEQRESNGVQSFPVGSVAANAVTFVGWTQNKEASNALKEQGQSGWIAPEREIKPSDFTVVVHVPEGARDNHGETWEQRFFTQDEKGRAVEDATKSSLPLIQADVEAKIGTENVAYLRDTMRSNPNVFEQETFQSSGFSEPWGAQNLENEASRSR